MKEIYRLENCSQHYAWGSPTAIPDLLGRVCQREGSPVAELWMGVHPRGPSRVLGKGSLRELIAAAPQEMLGSGLAEKYGTLPFLFKVLAAETSLSIQAHPSKKQAEEGWERENRMNIPLDGAHRNYRDDNHKPEVICALTPFWAMAGFRPMREIRRLFEPFTNENVRGALFLEATVVPEKRRLESFFKLLMTLEESEKRSLLAEAVQYASLQREEGEAYNWVVRLSEQYPNDIGILAPLYLNLIQLRVGEALFLPSGDLHAYLEGVGIELMANSDNVLRAGLTSKHQDLPEMMRVLTFSPTRPEVLCLQKRDEKEGFYATPAEEFHLSQIHLSKGDKWELREGNRAQIGIVTAGELLFCAEGARSMPLLRGTSFFIPHNAGPWRLSGEGDLYVAQSGWEG